MNVVIDTNIVVSALLSPFGNPARILDLVLRGDLTPVFDDRILAEYREVLNRPRFGFRADHIDDLLAFFGASGFAVSPAPLTIDLPGTSDAPFLEVAQSAGAVLITGNVRHFPEGVREFVRVLSPADFLDFWRNQA